MHMSRRAALRAACALPALAALAACSASQQASGVAIATAVIADVKNVLAGLSAASKLVPPATATTITFYLNDALAILGSYVPGSLVSVTSAATLVQDLQFGATAAALVLPGNPIVLAIQALLPIIAAALTLVPSGTPAPTPDFAPRSAVELPSPDDARKLLGSLPPVA